MRVYVAGKYSEKELIRSYIAELQKLNYVITRDWTLFEENDLADSAKKDIQAVQQADMLIVVMTDPKYAYRGTFTEIGCALGLDKKIIIISTAGDGAYYTTNCFYHHPSIVHLSSMDEMIQYIKGL